MTTLRLAVGGGATRELQRVLTEEGATDNRRPALLVSYFYLKTWNDIRATVRYRDWVLDSGAFSAWNTHARIDLGRYTQDAKRLKATDPTLLEIFSLDVIGDWRASARNCETMWSVGVKAIPTFHGGEPWDVLTALARDYPKIALGGVVGWKGETKFAWVGQCFARIWNPDRPVPVHGFGMTSKKMLLRYPLHSVDASTWEIGPWAYGKWASFNGQQLTRRIK